MTYVKSAKYRISRADQYNANNAKEKTSPEEILAGLMKRYGVSKRQAYRYIQEAQKTSNKLPIPQQKEVFTVKLPISLAFRIRELAKTTGESLSAVVTQALESFLKRKRHGKKGVFKGKFGCSTVLTGCPVISFLKFIDFWYQRRKYGH